MAKTVKESVETKAIGRDELVRLMDRITKDKKKAGELQSSLGGYVRGQLELYNLDRTAFNFVLKLNSLDANRRASVFRCLMQYVLLGDILSQMDFFDDAYSIMGEIMAERDAKPQKKADPFLSAASH